MILASLNLHGGRRPDGTPFDVVAGVPPAAGRHDRAAGRRLAALLAH